MNTNYHKSVLLEETINFISPKKGGKYIDATFGGGGHSRPILEAGGIVLGIDTDSDSIDAAKKTFGNSPDLILIQGNFLNIDEIAKTNGFEEVNGIVMDLGVSSHQIDDETRGFSYLKEGPLDMRMNRSEGPKAADLLNILGKGELYEIFNKYGQEPRAHAISNSIVRARRLKAFENTSDLTRIVEEAYGLRGEVNMKLKAQVNSRVFQALRIAVNDELNVIAQAVPKAFGLLSKGGRLAVISFHSLEDKIVKQTFVQLGASGLGNILTPKPISPSFIEISDNRRSRSAKLRVIERI